MRHRIATYLCLMSVFGLLIPVDAFSRGGGFARGGGGFSRGGGVSRGGFSGSASRGGFSGRGVSRPSINVGASRSSVSNRRPSGSSPSFSRPTTGAVRRPSIGQSGVDRPTVNPPGSTRPGFGGGAARPGQTPAFGTRPSVPSTIRPGSGPFGNAGTRPATPSSRPDVTRPGTGAPGASRPGAATLPGMSLPGFGTDRPGIGNGAAAVLPGDMRARFSGAASSRDLKAQVQNRQAQISDRRANISERHDNLQARLDDRHDAYDRQGQRQDFLADSREDWQEFHNDHYYHHHGWHDGCWHGPGSYWDHMWDHYPVYSAFRVTAWGINTASWMFGYRPYSNPYYEAPVTQNVYVDYSEPMLAETGTTETAPGTAETVSGTAAPPVPSDAATAAFDAAREAFRIGDYGKALQLTDETLKETPRDAVVHEFRALILFATGKYRESAAALYSILSVGPGWDWTTMSGLYSDINDYTTQLRRLEDFVKANSSSGEGHFVLGYHYMTCAHNDAALQQFQTLAKQQPEDVVIGSVISMLGGEPPAASRPAPPSAEVSSKDAGADSIPQEKLLGDWKASGPQSASFQLSLSADGKFTWSFSQRGETQSVSGVYALDGHVLAMEPDAGGMMLAEVKLDGAGGFSFRQIGTPESDAGLVFSKQ